MNDKTEASLLGGGQGAGIGARRAGYRSLWSVEYDSKIAGVATVNGFDMIVADVCAVDYSALQRPYWLHMSPVCTRASQANANATESDLDMSIALACCRAIVELQPRRISLENVWGYRNFGAFNAILATLTAEGYAFDYWHLNAADYGVPQTRRRLILVASKDHQPRRPVATHYDARSMPMNMFCSPWIGWYKAIEDLIPSLPDSAFAEWQKRLLPPVLLETMIITNNATKGIIGCASKDVPSPTILLPKSMSSWRAFIVHPNDRRSMTIRDQDDPSFTVMALDRRSTFLPRAFIVDGQPGNNNTTLTNSERGDPMYTILASADKKPARAFVGRVVKMTARALARFNGLEDSYILPQSNTLACTVLGNMHMPAIQHAIMEANG
jgi:site-specific DNA-cytosine methylase